MDLSKFHPAVLKIVTLLDSNNIWHEYFIHEPVRTSEEAAAVRGGYTLNQGAKALILRVRNKDGKRFVMTVVPGHLRVDNNKLKICLQSNDIRFATEQEVGEITGGVQVGGVPPFGNLFGLEVVVDPALFENEKIIFNAGDRRFSLAIKAEDYRMLVKPLITAIV